MPWRVTRQPSPPSSLPSLPPSPPPRRVPMLRLRSAGTPSRSVQCARVSVSSRPAVSLCGAVRRSVCLCGVFREAAFSTAQAMCATLLVLAAALSLAAADTSILAHRMVHVTVAEDSYGLPPSPAATHVHSVSCRLDAKHVQRRGRHAQCATAESQGCACAPFGVQRRAHQGDSRGLGRSSHRRDSAGGSVPAGLIQRTGASLCAS